MTFTPRHHQKVAACIRAAKIKHGDIPPIATLQSELAKMFEAEGSEFQPSEFEAGCSPSPDMTQARKVA